MPNNKVLVLVNYIKAFFYSNVYLGFYAVALCLETSLLLKLPFNSVIFYLLIFFCTCIYYSMIYVRSVKARNFDERTLWYRKHLPTIKATLRAAMLVVAALLSFLIVYNFSWIRKFTLHQYLLLLLFVTVAAWYTFSPVLFHVKKIRQTGWIKPFVVGLIWSGWVIVYPLVLLQERIIEGNISIAALLFFMQNFLFFSINAIIFDIKDYRSDLSHRLKTLPVIFGVRRTVSFILWPLFALNIFFVLLFQYVQQFTTLQTLLQLLPYVLLMPVIVALTKHKTVLYYLVIVDGLVLLKSLCSISSILLIKK